MTIDAVGSKFVTENRNNQQDTPHWGVQASKVDGRSNAVVKKYVKSMLETSGTT